MKASRVRDYVIYIAISLAIVGFGLWYVSGGGQGPSESALKWIGLAINTAILFGYAVSEYRQDWRHGRFWASVLGLLAVHLCVFSIILTHISHWGWLGFVLLFPMEQAGIEATLSRAGYWPLSKDNH